MRENLTRTHASTIYYNYYYYYYIELVISRGREKRESISIND